MRRGSTWLAVGSLIAGLAVGGAAAGTAAQPRRGGTLIYGADQEPGTLNPFVVGGGHAAIGLAHWPTMTGTFVVTPTGTYRNSLVSRVKFTRKPFTVTYFIKKAARWNDGTPLTANDYLFTFQTFMSKRWNIIVTIGYEDIARAKVVDAKTFKVTFRKPYAGWRDLFAEILPRHALHGEDFDNVWRNAIDNPKTGRPIASGPFVFQRWNRGSSMTVVRNERYWGPKSMLDRIVFRFIPDTNTQVLQLRSGEVDVMAPQVQPSFTTLKGVRGLRTLTSLGPVWEKVDINFGYRGNGHPLLRKRFVRQAIAHGSTGAGS